MVTTKLTDDREDRSLRARRLRVRELFGRSARVIAETLLDEGFEVKCGRKPRTKADGEMWEKRRLAAMTRNVINDKTWWREEWKNKRQLTGEDPNVAREEHLAALMSDVEEINELLDSGGTKATAKAILVGERRQTRALLAKALGVEELAPRDPEADQKRPLVVGLVIGTKNVSADARARLREQGIDLPEAS